MERRTKIIATFGPSILDFEVFSKVVEEGADIFRLNTSYGDCAQYDILLNHIKKISGKKLQVLYDVKKIDKIDYFVKNNLDILAVSFAENASQIQEYKQKAPNAFIVAKIETEKGAENLDELLSVSDGIMIGRGDLSKSVSIEKIPGVQKDISRKTVEHKKFLITATEMMLSMTNNTKPEVAEVSDVGNAVFDGTSATMLSEETAIGKHPVETVRFMRRIIEEAESWMSNNPKKD